MTYDYRQGIGNKKKHKKWLVILPTVFLVAGMYVLLTALSPAIPILDNRPNDATAEKLVRKEPGDEGNRIFIPQINIDVAVVEGDSELALEKGAWHRNPQNGSPKEGGNFVLSAHRFLLGMTPGETRTSSPFYHIDKLQVGDDLFVDYEGVRYVYQVSKKYEASENAADIEAPSETDKLTLYSYDLGGPEEGREVIEARPVGTVAWNGSQSYIQSAITGNQ